MPSYLVHTIAGEKLMKHLSLTEEEKNQFFISNLLPDVKEKINTEGLSKEEIRNQTQIKKRITHFRTEFNHAFEYPDLNYFLSKYKESVKNDIKVFGYFFHLYTDYYYFKNYLPTIITFLDKDENISPRREDNKYVIIKNKNKRMDHEDFWDNTNKDSLYQEYSRLNKLLVRDYNIQINPKKLQDYIKKKNYKIDIEEVNPEGMNTILNQISDIIKEAKEGVPEELIIFTEKQITDMIEKIVTSFLKDYKKIIPKRNIDNKY